MATPFSATSMKGARAHAYRSCSWLISSPFLLSGGVTCVYVALVWVSNFSKLSHVHALKGKVVDVGRTRSHLSRDPIGYSLYISARYGAPIPNHRRITGESQENHRISQLVVAPTRDQMPLAEGRRLGVPVSASGTALVGRVSRRCDSSWNERMAWGWLCGLCGGVGGIGVD
jgi:hypothetical protein